MNFKYKTTTEVFFVKIRIRGNITSLETRKKFGKSGSGLIFLNYFTNTQK